MAAINRLPWRLRLLLGYSSYLFALLFLMLGWQGIVQYRGLVLTLLFAPPFILSFIREGKIEPCNE